MKRLRVQHLGPIADADVTFGDLTVLVGPQASGKSLFVQTVKAVCDAKAIRNDLKSYGFDWKRNAAVQSFAEAYYGGGLRNLLNDKVRLTRDGNKSIKPSQLALPVGKATEGESVYLIPAQRVLMLQDGWPRPFMAYPISDPYSIKRFSESVRLLLERGLGQSAPIFPQPKRLKADLRDLLDRSIYQGGSLRVESEGPRKRIVLKQPGADAITVGSWSAGQREFTPLLLGLYWLMPGTRLTKRDEVGTVIIEEPEMGLHPQAIVNLGLLLLELLFRGYQVIVSTHSPVILDLVWALKELKSAEKASAHDALKHVFHLGKLLPQIKDIFDTALEKTYRVYYFERNDGNVTARDISSLDPSSSDPNVSGWGGLSGFSGDIARAVGEALA